MADKRIMFKALANFCQQRSKNKIKPKANKKPFLVWANKREKVKKRETNKQKKKAKNDQSDSGATKKIIKNQTNQKKMARIKVGKKFRLLAIDSILIDLMIQLK